MNALADTAESRLQCREYFVPGCAEDAREIKRHGGLDTAWANETVPANNTRN
jgi:hypothetical protein